MVLICQFSQNKTRKSVKQYSWLCASVFIRGFGFSVLVTLLLPLLLLRTNFRCVKKKSFDLIIYHYSPFQQCNRHSPSGHIFGRVTLCSGFVENKTGRAAQCTLLNTIDANVEFLAICGVRVLWMGNKLSI